MTFEQYVMLYWRPNTELFIQLNDQSNLYIELKDWFDNRKEETISIGPFINIYPYGYVLEPDQTKKYKENIYEFLFLCEDIDKSKLTAKFLEI